MFGIPRKFWEAIISGIVMLVIAIPILIWLCVSSYSFEKNHTVAIGDGINVLVDGPFQYDKEGKVSVHNEEMVVMEETAYQPNQFYRFDGPAFAQKPSFTIYNHGKVPREIHIKTLSGWITPFSGQIFLQPGKNFQFAFQPVKDSKYWFCWINVVND